MTFPRNEDSIVYQTESDNYLTVVREIPGTSVLVDVHERQPDGSWSKPTRSLVKPSMVTGEYRMGRKH